MIPEAMLCAALALPHNGQSVFNEFRLFVEKYKPGYTVVFVNDRERLLNKNAEWTPILIRGLAVWAIREDPKEYLKRLTEGA